MGRTVCKTVPCYILSLIRGTAIIRTLPIICGAHQFHSFLPAVSVSKGKYPGWSLIALRNLKMVYFHVYRLEEDGSVLKEGGVRLTV